MDTPEEPAAKQQEAVPVAENNQEMEVDSIAHVQRKEDSPVAEATQEVTPPAEKQEVTPAVENEQGQEDKMDEEGDKKNQNKPVFSMVLRRSRNKTAPKYTSKRMRKKALAKEEKGRGRTAGGKSGRRRQQKEHKGKKGNKRRGRRGREQVRRRGAKENPRASHKMVLRSKTRLVQPTRKTRAKRRGKI